MVDILTNCPPFRTNCTANSSPTIQVHTFVTYVFNQSDLKYSVFMAVLRRQEAGHGSRVGVSPSSGPMEEVESYSH